MEKVSIVLGNNKDLKVETLLDGDFICIKGYDCKKECESCGLYGIGDEIEIGNLTCKHLNIEESVFLKIKVHEGEVIQLI